jgi:acetyl esterase/lipase
VQGSLPVVLYIHGGGWILGSFISHGRLARELAVGANAVVAFVEYALAPQARYPVQIEQCYTAAKWLMAHAAEYGIDSSRLAVAGDSAGGNMATVLAILAKKRCDLHIVQQSLYYPMTDTGHDTESDRQFHDGPYGTAAVMDWFYDAYLDESVDRTAITVSPLQATPADLEGLPPALVIVDENDVLRDQGEAYANKLRDAGVPVTSVRFNGTMHDFMMLNALRDTESTRAAIGLAAATLRRAFDSGSVA